MIAAPHFPAYNGSERPWENYSMHQCARKQGTKVNEFEAMGDALSKLSSKRYINDKSVIVNNFMVAVEELVGTEVFEQIKYRALEITVLAEYVKKSKKDKELAMRDYVYLAEDDRRVMLPVNKLSRDEVESIIRNLKMDDIYEEAEVATIYDNRDIIEVAEDLLQGYVDDEMFHPTELTAEYQTQGE